MPARSRSAPGPPTSPAPLVVELDPRSPRAIAADFRRRLEAGAPLVADGEARQDPSVFLESRYLPHHRFALFDATFELTDFRFEEGLNFLVAYVGLPDRRGRRTLHPRIFYKDSSLLWRVASHVIRGEGEEWIGKGDVKWEREDGVEYLVSDEDTTNLPYEIQGALDRISRARKARRDEQAVALVLRNAPPGRLRPYADFSRPRQQAARETPLNGGRKVARLRRRGDPSSLWFARGFAPDLDDGFLVRERSGSRLYGGAVEKLRFLSENRLVQYQFVVTPTQLWINPPQALTRAITSYGLRALHVPADDEIFLPGYEYCFLDEREDPPRWHSQIPEGFVGEPSPVDPRRRDASAWIEALPVIAELRRKVLGRRRRRRA